MTDDRPDGTAPDGDDEVPGDPGPDRGDGPSTDGAVAAARPAERSSRRRAVAVLGSAALVTAVLATVAVAVTRSDDDPGAAEAGRDVCPSGVDTLAVTVSSSVRDDDLIDGFSSVAVLRTDRPDDLTYLNEDPRQAVVEPSIAPTGDQVALTWADGDYESAGPGSESVWVVGTDGTGARPLTTGTFDRPSRWSPDGLWIAYTGVIEEDDTRRITVEVVPAQGGRPRRLTLLPPGSTAGRLVWTPDSTTVVVVAETYDREPGMPEATPLVAVTLDGDQREVARLPGWTESLTMVPDGDEVLVGIRDVRNRAERLAIDLTTGDRREIGGPAGEVGWSVDGRRAYMLVLDDDRWVGRVHRVRYDGSAFHLGDRVLERDGMNDLDVGPCVDHAVSPPTVPDQPLIGSEWTLGPRSLVVSGLEPTDGCDGDDCTRVRVERFEQVWGPPDPGVGRAGDGSADDPPTPTDDSVLPPATSASPGTMSPGSSEAPEQPELREVLCSAHEGELRGTTFTVEKVRQEDEGCGFVPGTPRTLEVDGALLRISYGSETWETVTYGALFVGAEPEPVTTPTVAGPAIADLPGTTTTTAPVPEIAPCDDVRAFGERLAGAAVRTERPTAASPTELADRASLVVRGLLTGADLVSWPEGPGVLSIGYTVVVDEVLVAPAGVDADVDEGDEIGAVLSFDPAGPDSLPPLGQDAGLPSPGGKPDGSVPVVAFLTDEDAPYRTWQVDGPDALAIGCPGEPIGGLVGEGPGWDDVTDIDDLADRVRDR